MSLVEKSTVAPVFERDGVRIFHGDCRDVLKQMPAASINCCVTSGPYWGLRDYGNKPSVWGGSECIHEWGQWQAKHDEREATQSGKSRTTERFYGAESRKFNGNHQKHTAGAWCQQCGAWLGCYGLEPTPEMFVEHTVEIFREVARVLHPSGTLWLNLGDSYNGSGAGGGGNRKGNEHGQHDAMAELGRPQAESLKPKDLCMIPRRVFLALQADGWYLRSIICWAKKSPMPESVTDRPTNSWEPIALLTRNAKYFYDAEAVKEEALQPEGEPNATGQQKAHDVRGRGNGVAGSTLGTNQGPSSRNMRNVWHLGPEPYPDAHFATFPTEIPRRAIKAGTSEHGCCPACRAPYKRVVDKTKGTPASHHGSAFDAGKTGVNGAGRVGEGPRTVQSRTTGWEPTCKCNAGKPVPCRVLDPFFGSGTTGEVAQELGCECDGIELNPEYIELAKERFKQRTFLVGA